MPLRVSVYSSALVTSPRATVRSVSACLISLAASYALAVLCAGRRELYAALAASKPIVLLKEEDPRKGGLPLASIEVELLEHCGDYEGGGGAEAVRSRVLRGGAPLIPFDQRFNTDFQLTSLRLLVAALHSSCTTRASRPDSGKVSALTRPCPPPPL